MRPVVAPIMRPLALATAVALSVLVAVLDGNSRAATPAARPLVTGIDGRDDFDSPRASESFRLTRSHGGRIARIVVAWAAVAPKGDVPPEGFDPTDPASPAYDWASIDAQVRLARRNRLEPLLSVYTAPPWASGQQASGDRGPTRPDPEAFADFATAAAERYSGAFQGLPRVRFWQAWNEPNLSNYLWPQFQRGQAVSPSLYRSLLNAFYDAIHAVKQDNRVVAGGTAPFTVRTPAYTSVGPLRFARELLCLSRGAKPRRTCTTTVKLDVWGHHPYTSGGPTHEAARPDDVSIPDLHEIKVLLDEAQRNGTVVSVGPVEFWVDEFSWDSAPPDPKGVPMPLLARWLSEGLYRMWSGGVTTVIWYQMFDDVFDYAGKGCDTCGFAQSGLHFNPGETRKYGARPGQPKPTARAFRFPFVAFHRPDGKIELWGRTPTSKPAAVVVERRARGAAWQRFSTFRANRYGIFQATLLWPGAQNESLRARAAGDVSVPFSLVVPPDRPVCPFGTC